MSARTLAAFSTIRTEGAMLPSDILVRETRVLDDGCTRDYL